MLPPVELTAAVSVTEAPAVMEALEDLRVMAVAAGDRGAVVELDDPELQPEQPDARIHAAKKPDAKEAEIGRFMKVPCAE